MTINKIKPANISDEMTTDVELANAVSSKVDSTDNRLYTIKELRVKKNPGSGEFSSIASAISSISGATATNPFVIKVGPTWKLKFTQNKQEIV